MQVDDNLSMDESAERNYTVTEPSLVSILFTKVVHVTV